MSEIAGTTRDTIEEVLNIDGILFRLIDTAGIREHTADEIEASGIERSLEKMRTADVVLYIFDANDMHVDELKTIISDFNFSKTNYLLIANKTDIADIESLKNKYDFIQPLFISAKENTGIDDLKQRLFKTVIHDPLTSENVIITNSRHLEALEKVSASLHDIKAGLDNNIPGDLLALDIRHCLHYISEITGDITNDTVLDYVFSKFCIGK